VARRDGRRLGINQTPHSLFWDIDGLGYVFLNLATVFAAPLFARTGPDRWVRWFFLANGLITPLFAITYFFPVYSVPSCCSEASPGRSPCRPASCCSPSISGAA
jgi:hypothetical protein